MGNVYYGKLAVANNYSANCNSTSDKTMTITLAHSCSNKTEGVINNLTLAPSAASGTYDFICEEDENDYWEFTIIMNNETYNGTIKANYDRWDTPGVALINLHHGGADKIEVEFSFPKSGYSSDDIKKQC